MKLFSPTTVHLTICVTPYILNFTLLFWSRQKCSHLLICFSKIFIITYVFKILINQVHSFLWNQALNRLWVCNKKPVDYSTKPFRRLSLISHTDTWHLLDRDTFRCQMGLVENACDRQKKKILAFFASCQNFGKFLNVKLNRKSKVGVG